MVAARYIEINPVAAGVVTRAEDWPWSSARAHIAGKSEGLTDVGALGQHVRNWRAMLAEGLEAGDAADTVESALKTGRRPDAAAAIPKRGRPPKAKIGTVPIF